MIKKYQFWLKSAIVLQSLTAFFHSLSFLNDPVAENATEQQLLDLMSSYHIDAGAGFTPNMQDLFTAMSSCFSLLVLMGALINWFLLRVKAEERVLKGIIIIELIIFGICFLTMAFLTFLPPIILTGLIFLTLILSYWTLTNKTFIN
jgi:hypothetical protein